MDNITLKQSWDENSGEPIKDKSLRQHWNPDPATQQQWSVGPTTQGELLAREGSRGGSVINPQNPRDFRKQEEKKENADNLALFQLQGIITAQQAFEQIEVTRAHLNDFSEMLADGQIKLDQMLAELEDNAVTMNDGRKVYFDTETGRYVHQAASGDWQELANDEDIAEASAKHEAMGEMSSRQGMGNYAQLQKELNDSLFFISSANARLDTIQEKSANGELTPEETVGQTLVIEAEREQQQKEWQERSEQMNAPLVGVNAGVEEHAVEQEVNKNKEADEYQKTDEFDSLLEDLETDRASSPTQGTLPTIPV